MTGRLELVRGPALHAEVERLNAMMRPPFWAYKAVDYSTALPTAHYWYSDDETGPVTACGIDTQLTIEIDADASRRTRFCETCLTLTTPQRNPHP